VDHPTLTNRDLGELLWRDAEQEAGHRRQALRRASRAASFWTREAAAVAAGHGALTELRNVGPWVATRISSYLDDPPDVPEPPPERRGFLTLAEVRAVLDADRSWEAEPVADLQVHTTDSDGALPLDEMVEAARGLGRSAVAITDHSESLQVANGMTPERRADQGRRIDAWNARLVAEGDGFRVLRSIEMDVFADGAADASPEMLADLDIVLGAFHSKLRSKQDETDRYLAALRNPAVQVLAHPTARMYGRRVGLTADWPRVFAEAARLGKAVELDATPARQDLPPELAAIAVREGVRWFTIGSDAHSAFELAFLPFGLAIAALAGVPRDRILSYRTPDGIRDWAAALRGD
jgi:histidinol phosphatase-like PHP family hydrolase